MGFGGETTDQTHLVQFIKWDLFASHICRESYQ